MAFAGSLVSTPKLMVGVSVTELSVSFVSTILPPKTRLCAPRDQVNVSLKSRNNGLRRVGALTGVGPLMPKAAAIPVALFPGAPPRLKPAWLATEPTKSAGLAAGLKREGPPERPARASLTRVGVKVERNATEPV